MKALLGTVIIAVILLGCNSNKDKDETKKIKEYTRTEYSYSNGSMQPKGVPIQKKVFDAEGRDSVTINYEKTGAVSERVFHRYDSLSNLKSLESYDAGGNLTSKTEYIFEKETDVMSLNQKQSDDQELKEINGEIIRKIMHQQWITNEYNKYSNAWEKTIYNAFKAYDKDDHLIYYKLYANEALFIENHYSNIFNDEGRIIKQYTDDMILEVEYNLDRNIVETTFREKDGSFFSRRRTTFINDSLQKEIIEYNKDGEPEEKTIYDYIFVEE